MIILTSLMKRNSVKLVILGCPKNKADAEDIAGILKENGFLVTEDDIPTDVVILLTCSFVRDAEEEAVDFIQSLIEEKKRGKFNALIVAGCFPQRHRNENLREALPEVDAWLGAHNYKQVPDIVKKVIDGYPFDILPSQAGYLPGKVKRKKLGTEPFAYVKISEGCKNRCAYCTIPLIRGDFRSRRMNDIVDECAKLVEEQGVKEIVLVGQDTALYGTDLYGESKLALLLKKTAKRIGKAWLRVMYSHPAHLEFPVLDAIAEHSNICRYLDIPIQHASTTVLKRMGRHCCRSSLEKLIISIRKHLPEAVLRTTVMVGFPGETQAEFQELLDFIKWARFERLGAFPYSREEGTRAYEMRPQVSAKVKERRLDAVMMLQQEISWEIQQEWVGRELDVLVDGQAPDREGWVVARSMFHAPEVDAGIYINNAQLKVGEMVKVKITDALAYDLEGELM